VIIAIRHNVSNVSEARSIYRCKPLNASSVFSVNSNCNCNVKVLTEITLNVKQPRHSTLHVMLSLNHIN